MNLVFMNDPKNYPTAEFIEKNEVSYFFVSEGNDSIIKTVQYSHITDLKEGSMYNLGFGDYDIDNNTFSDKSINNNGDHYRVLYTVLSTVPKFFEKHPSSMILVQGSDSTSLFPDYCKLTCQKKCGSKCRNIDRRIKIYRSYVDKHFEELNKNYSFYGGFELYNSKTSLEDYESYTPGKEYNSVICKNKSIDL